jgi:hypothetical protein
MKDDGNTYIPLEKKKIEITKRKKNTILDYISNYKNIN